MHIPLFHFKLHVLLYTSTLPALQAKWQKKGILLTSFDNPIGVEHYVRGTHAVTQIGIALE